jgi:hypothetical protein
MPLKTCRNLNTVTNQKTAKNLLCMRLKIKVVKVFTAACALRYALAMWRYSLNVQLEPMLNKCINIH